MSELPPRASCANPSVRATFAGAGESLTGDQVVDLWRVSGRSIRCGLNRLKLHAVAAHARDPGHYSGMSPDRCLRKGRRIADLPCEPTDARVQRNELHKGVARR